MVGIKLRSKVGPKGQVVIPKPIREHFRIGKDSELVFDIKDGTIIITKKNSDQAILEDMFSLVKKKKLPKHIDWNEKYYSQFGER